MSPIGGPLASPAFLLHPPDDGAAGLPSPIRHPGRGSPHPPSSPPGELSDRDLDLLKTIARFRIMSGAQLREMFWPEGTAETKARLARRTLARLAKRDLLVALPRRVGGVRAGSAGLTFALGVQGHRLLKAPGRARPPHAPGQYHLQHTLAVADLYVSLVQAARWGLTELLAFDTEPGCWREYPGTYGAIEVLKPDAHVRLAGGEFEDSWFIELDMGTQASITVARKAERYVDCFRAGGLQQTEGVFPRTLWIAPDASRAEIIEAALARVPEATDLFAVTTSTEACAVLTAGAQP